MKNLCAVCALALSASAATAQDAGDTSVALGLSTFGANIEAAYRIDPSYRVRGALMGGLNLDYEESDADGDFEGSFDLGGMAVLGDFYPMQNGWRVSGGVFFSNTELSATGTTSIDGVIGDQSVTTTAKFSSEIAPMLTTGYDLTFGDGWSFNSEIGVIFNGGIDLDVVADNAAVQDQVDNDADVQEAKDDAKDISVLPYLSLTFGYSF